MRVLVTGATGFVGSHSAAALARDGHDVRVFVRDPAKVPRTFAPHGVEITDVAQGDVTDRASVERALDGCDAVLHAAALVATDRARAREVTETNARGTENVLCAAHERRLDPIVFVSSVEALSPAGRRVLTPDCEPASEASVYGRSKADGERIARRLQADGVPVVTTYPGGVWGPLDPGLSEAVRGLLMMMSTRVVPITSGGFPVVDVRDLAGIHTALMAPGRGPRRYMAGGHFLPLAKLAHLVHRVTGRYVVQVPAPPVLLRGAGLAVDVARRAVPVANPVSYDAMTILTRGIPADSSATVAELGIRFRDSVETIADTLRYQYEAGRISRRLVGRLAADGGRDAVSAGR